MGEGILNGKSQKILDSEVKGTYAARRTAAILSAISFLNCSALNISFWGSSIRYCKPVLRREDAPKAEW